MNPTIDSSAEKKKSNVFECQLAIVEQIKKYRSLWSYPSKRAPTKFEKRDVIKVTEFVNIHNNHRFTPDSILKDWNNMKLTFFLDFVLADFEIVLDEHTPKIFEKLDFLVGINVPDFSIGNIEYGVFKRAAFPEQMSREPEQTNGGSAAAHRQFHPHVIPAPRAHRSEPMAFFAYNRPVAHNYTLAAPAPIAMHLPPPPTFDDFDPEQMASELVLNKAFWTITNCKSTSTRSLAHFYPSDSEGVARSDVHVLLAFLNIFCFTMTSLSILSYYGVRSYLKIRQLLAESGRSKYTRTLQKQLYKALVIQVSIPLLFMFIPVGIFVAGPLIYLNVEWMSKVATNTYALYPAIDPIPLIFIVDEYRRATIAIFKLEMFKTNKVSIAPPENLTVSGNQVVG